MSASSTVHRGLRRWAGGLAARIPWSLDAYRWLRNPAWQRAVSDDLRRTRRSSRFLSKLPPAASDGSTAVVSLYRDDVFDTKLALVLASALRTRGVRPVILTPTARDRRIRRYARAFGIREVRSRDQVRLTPGERDRVERVAQALLAGTVDLDTVREWTDDGQRIGYHVVSTLIRRTFDGSPELDLEATRGLLGAIAREVLTAYVVCRRILDEETPALVLVEEANYAVNGPMVDLAVARGIDVVQTITTWRDDALMSKRLTVHNRRVDAKSVAPETLARLAACDQFPPVDTLDAELDADFGHRYDGRWALSAQFQPDTREFTADEIVARVGLDPTKPTAVVFAHVLWDATLFFGVDLFDSYADWLDQTVRAAAENPDLNWIVKAHPSNVFRSAHGDIAAGASSEAEIVRAALPEWPEHVFLLTPDTPISTLSLHRFADIGLTVRGTAGLELACFGAPVLTAGTGAYSGLGFTVDSTSRAEYLERLAGLPDVAPPEAADARHQARRYAHTLFLRRPWIARSFALSFAFLDRGWHPLDRNLEWTVTSVDALGESPDLGAWADWALRGRGDDFLVLDGSDPAPDSP